MNLKTKTLNHLHRFFLTPFVLFFLSSNSSFASLQCSSLLSGADDNNKIVEKLFKNAQITLRAPDLLQEEYYNTTVYEVKFGKMSREEFNALKSYYNNSSEVKYSPNRSYELVDFLPPMAQATLNKVFKAKTNMLDIDTPSLRDFFMDNFYGSVELQTLSNCWNAAFGFLNSMLKGSKLLTLFLPNPYSVEAALDDYKQIDNVKDLIPGDLVVIKARDPNYAEEQIQHVAVVIGPNLVFEKTEAYGLSPFRIFKLDETIAQVNERIFDNDMEALPVTFRRASENSFSRPWLKEIGNLEAIGLSDIVNAIKAHGVDPSGVYIGTAADSMGKPVLMSQLAVTIPLVIDEETGHYRPDPSHENTARFESF